MRKKDRIKKRLDKIRGEILSDTIEIESYLTLRLLHFFYPKQTPQKTALYWSILNTNRFGFDAKIKLYQKISYFQKLKSYDSIMKSLRFVQKLRNQVAHSNLVIPKSRLDHVVLRSSTVKDVIVNEKLLEEFDKHKKTLLSKLRVQ